MWSYDLENVSWQEQKGDLLGAVAEKQACRGDVVPDKLQGHKMLAVEGYLAALKDNIAWVFDTE